MRKRLFSLILCLYSIGGWIHGQVTYNLAYDSGTETYTVSMRSGKAYNGGLARISSSTQIMIVAPHTTGGYQLTDLTDLQTGSTPLDWGFARIDAPLENPTKDYFFFSPSNAVSYTPFDIAANTQIDLFSFQSGSGCLGELSIMENTDSFAGNGSFNTTNSFVVVGGGITNQYQGNTSGAISCIDAGVTYCLEYDGSTDAYIVSMESAAAFSGGLARLTRSTQITLVFPHETGGFQINNLTDLQTTGTPLNWAFDRMDAPAENTSADYLFFSPANAFTYTPFDIAANTKIPLFSFKLGSVCSGEIALYNNETDPLKNNTQYEVANNLVIVGGGSMNQYAGNACPSVSCANNTCLELKVLLQGALFGGTDTLMRDDLRQQGFLPREQPYQAATMGARFTHIGGGNEVANPIVLANNLNTPDAIVDWVFIEYRDAADQSVFRTQSALVQRDGDVVDPSDGNCVRLHSDMPDNFYIAIKHRNHLGAMTAFPLTLTSETLRFDFTKDDISEIAFTQSGYDSLAMIKVNGKYALWGGNCLNDDKTKYSGKDNDQLVVNQNILSDPNNVNVSKNFNNTIGYHSGDVNMDGKVKFEGIDNDRILIQFIVINYPLNSSMVRNFDLLLEQLP